MLIRAPCRLGERFRAADNFWFRDCRGWDPYLVGLSLFDWSCCKSIDDVTIEWSRAPYLDCRCAYCEPENLARVGVAFEIPTRLVNGEGGVTLRDFGGASDKPARLAGIRLLEGGGWTCTLIVDGTGGKQVDLNNEILAGLFAPVLPAVGLRLEDFLG